MQDTKIDGKVYSLQFRITIDVKNNTATCDDGQLSDTLYLIMASKEDLRRPRDSAKALGFDYLIP